jgi:hypothetical protein
MEVGPMHGMEVGPMHGSAGRFADLDLPNVITRAAAK